MTSYTDVFGGANIYPSEVSYQLLTLTSSVSLSWPNELSDPSFVLSKVMDITSSSASYGVTLPAANKASLGETVLINNVGSNSVVLKNYVGSQILVVAPGTSWQLYLTNNTSEAGSWKSLQYGSLVSEATASNLVGTGVVAIGSTLSQSVPVSTFSSNYTAGPTDRAVMFVWTGSAGTFTLPAASSVGNNWFCYFRNSGTGAVVVDPSGSPTIDSYATLSFQPGESAIIVTDGANYFTIGFGQPAVFAFDYTVIDVSGSGSYTLTGTELNRIGYKFTGTLTADRFVIVPTTVQQYWVDNQTSGAYTLTIKTASGTGIAISTGQRAIFYCDGVNVVDADTSTISLPVQVSQGGTGATTSSAARINLGATSLGDSIFTAANPAAVWSALGAAPIGVVDGGTF